MRRALFFHLNFAPFLKPYWKRIQKEEDSTVGKVKMTMKEFVKMAIESQPIDEKRKEETLQKILKKVCGENYKPPKKE